MTDPRGWTASPIQPICIAPAKSTALRLSSSIQATYLQIVYALTFIACAASMLVQCKQLTSEDNEAPANPDGATDPVAVVEEGGRDGNEEAGSHWRSSVRPGRTVDRSRGPSQEGAFSPRPAWLSRSPLASGLVIRSPRSSPESHSPVSGARSAISTAPAPTSAPRHADGMHMDDLNAIVLDPLDTTDRAARLDSLADAVDAQSGTAPLDHRAAGLVAGEPRVGMVNQLRQLHHPRPPVIAIPRPPAIRAGAIACFARAKSRCKSLFKAIRTTRIIFSAYVSALAAISTIMFAAALPATASASKGFATVQVVSLAAMGLAGATAAGYFGLSFVGYTRHRRIKTPRSMILGAEPALNAAVQSPAAAPLLLLALMTALQPRALLLPWHKSALKLHLPASLLRDVASVAHNCAVFNEAVQLGMVCIAWQMLLDARTASASSSSSAMWSTATFPPLLIGCLVFGAVLIGREIAAGVRILARTGSAGKWMALGSGGDSIDGEDGIQRRLLSPTASTTPSAATPMSSSRRTLTLQSSQRHVDTAAGSGPGDGGGGGVGYVRPLPSTRALESASVVPMPLPPALPQATAAAPPVTPVAPGPALSRGTAHGQPLSASRGVVPPYAAPAAPIEPSIERAGPVRVPAHARLNSIRPVLLVARQTPSPASTGSLVVTSSGGSTTVRASPQSSGYGGDDHEDPPVDSDGSNEAN